MVKICEALSNPIRIKIYYLLSEKPYNIYELSKTIGLSRPVIYAHLKKLENADLVESTMILEEGRAKKMYRAKDFSLYIDKEVIRNLMRGKG